MVLSSASMPKASSTRHTSAAHGRPAACSILSWWRSPSIHISKCGCDELRVCNAQGLVKLHFKCSSSNLLVETRTGEIKFFTSSIRTKNNSFKKSQKVWILTRISVQTFWIYTGHLFQNPLILFSVSVQRFSVSVQSYVGRNDRGERDWMKFFGKNHDVIWRW